MDKFKFMGVNFRKCLSPPLNPIGVVANIRANILNQKPLNYYYYPTNIVYFVYNYITDNSILYLIRSMTPIIDNGKVRIKINANINDYYNYDNCEKYKQFRYFSKYLDNNFQFMDKTKIIDKFEKLKLLS